MVRVVDFHAEWCGPCKQQDPILDDLDDEYADNEVTIERVDVDENQDMANDYQVRSLPTLIVFDDDDEVVDRFVGVTQKDDLEASIADAQ